MNIPVTLRQNVQAVLGDQGTTWIDSLASIVEHLASLWQLTDIRPFQNLSYNFVAVAYSHQLGALVVLKICLPDGSFLQEKEALLSYNGFGCVALRDWYEAHHALLLEALEPGTSLASFFPHEDEQAVRLTVEVMKRLHAAPIGAVPQAQTMEDWLQIFKKLEVPDVLKTHVVAAQSLAQRLYKTQPPRYLLHGDLHHENIILGSHNTWKAIDPKGVVGEQAYEVGAFMINPAGLLSCSSLKELFEMRLSTFSNLLAIDRERLIAASYVRAILSACWSVEEHADWKNDLICAELIKSCSIHWITS